MSSASGSQGAVLLEIVEVGGSIQVRAVDECDGLEVSFVASARTPRADIERLAVLKLGYVRSRAGVGSSASEVSGRSGSGIDGMIV